ncbi:amino acid adenylation domain-containing protein [Marininema mesophilum]|uniref:Amino acid adenylation domain-containing protein n=1 Tax=Marininema mesophilum TaxID=1048340 RepID=A0A1H2YGW5_9BACL|nr:non-ribosomal peptide synthetase [Marininema mesophilum]SDX04453.1 amino acid adenylation domain-containing protein [Marininema mesophilum]
MSSDDFDVKRKLIEEIMKKRGLKKEECSITKYKGELAPLSFSQQRIWFLDQFEENLTAYNMPFALELQGNLQTHLLEKSLNKVIEKHETLRTVIVMKDGEAYQKVLSKLYIPLRIVDLKHQEESVVQTKFKEEALQPFSLADGPLLRASLLKISDHKYVLMVNMHHMISDGWSLGIFYKELSIKYNLLLKNNLVSGGELEFQYKDYSAWQRNQVKKGVYDQQLRYWKKKLSGNISILNLPRDQKKGEVKNRFEGGHENITISSQLTSDLKKLTINQGITLYTVLLSAFNVLLNKYTNETDILVGTPIANRKKREFESMIGLFLNTLVIRSDLSENPTFRELLTRASETIYEALENQDIPFEKVVEVVQPERNLNRNPFFDVFFNFVNTPSVRPIFEGLVAKTVNLKEPESKNLLTMYIEEVNDQLLFQFIYQKAFFSEERISSFLNQYIYLLQQIVASPDKRIDEYSLLSEKNTKQKSSQIEEKKLPLVTEQIIRIGKENPTKIALKQGEKSWTYKHLVDYSTAIANRLDICKSDVVAITGTKSFGFIASIIAVWLKGGVILTLDPDLPKNRRKVMIKEAKAQCIIEVTHKKITADPFVDLPYLHVLSDNVGLEAVMDQPKDFKVGGNDPAYIFFTSGTTGKPKGVLGVHKGLSHFLTWQRDEFQISSDDKCAQITGLSFDVLLRDLFLPLVSGATLCLPEDEMLFTGESIFQWLHENEMTVIHVVPSLAKSWLGSLKQSKQLSFLKWVFSAGEPLTDSLIQDWKEKLQFTGSFVNLYGPTETTLAKLSFKVDEVVDGIQPVGYAIPQAQALVIKNQTHLCGDNEVGEIAIRTPYRTLGYINNAEEQNKRFIPNPFTNEVQDLLYLTGDLGRIHPKGFIELVGRRDDQIKVRGVRVHLNEIESVLAKHSQVEAGIVISLKNERGDLVLVAYVVPKREEDLAETKLRIYLEERLPFAVVPSIIIFMNKIPTTKNGKVDKKALPEPEVQKRTEVLMKEPETETEKVIYEIWSDLLQVDSFSCDDDFFVLGGHSLLATQVLSRIREYFSMYLELKHLFEHRTVRQIAKEIEKNSIKNKEIKVSSIKRVARSTRQASLKLDEI